MADREAKNALPQLATAQIASQGDHTMEPIVVVVLLIAAAVVLSGGLSDGASTAHMPAYIVIQPGLAEPAQKGSGCLPWVIVGAVLLVLLGLSQNV